MNLAVSGNGLAVMNHVDCVIKRDVYLQKMLSCIKDIRNMLKKKYISWVILHGYSRS